MVRPVLILLVMLVFQTAAHAQKQAAFQVFDGSLSPDKRYTLAWGVPGHPEKKTAASIDDLDSVENYVVDLRTHTIKTRIEGCRYFPSENHGGIMHAWSKDDSFLAVIHSGKWSPRGIYVLAFPKTGKASQVNLTSQIHQDLFGWLAHHSGSGFRKARVHLTLDCSFIQITSDNQLDLSVSTYIPKQEDGWMFSGKMLYRLTRADGKVKATLRSVTQTDPTASG
jgi:hypothetical protein